MAKMSFKNRLALIGIPLLIVALAAAVYIAPKETSTESQASSNSACETKCNDSFKSNPNNLDRCLKTCTNWHLNKDIRPLYCTLTSSAITTLGQPENRANYRAVRDNIRTALDTNTATSAPKLKKELTKFTAPDTKNAYKKYCIEHSQDE